MSIGLPYVQGKLTAPIVRRYMKRHAAEITTCYEEPLAANPDLSGTVMVSFLINKRGKVSILSSAGVDPAIASCVAAVIKAIEFPAPSDNRTRR